MSKFSTWFIGGMILSVIVVTFSIAIAIGGETYGTFSENSTDLNESFIVYNKINKLNENLNTTKDGLNFEADTSFLSQLDALFTQGFNLLKIMLDSVDLTNTMIDESIDTNPLILSEAKQYFKAAGFFIILVIAIIGIVLSTLTKREQ